MDLVKIINSSPMFFKKNGSSENVLAVNKQSASTYMSIYFFVLLSDMRTARQIFKHCQAYSPVSYMPCKY